MLEAIVVQSTAELRRRRFNFKLLRCDLHFHVKKDKIARGEVRFSTTHRVTENEKRPSFYKDKEEKQRQIKKTHLKSFLSI